MSLDNPQNEKEAYVKAIRLYVENFLGTELKSVNLSNQEYRTAESKKTFRIELIRFQQHFSVALPIDNLPYLDLFIDPVTTNPHIKMFGKNSFSSDLEEPVPPQQIEHLFVSLLWGAEFTKKGIKAAVKAPCIQ